MERPEPRQISDFDMKEVYRLLHLESIPGFSITREERSLLREYREALKRQIVAEESYEIDGPADAPKITIKTHPEEPEEVVVKKPARKKSTRKKKAAPKVVEEES